MGARTDRIDDVKVRNYQVSVTKHNQAITKIRGHSGTAKFRPPEIRGHSNSLSHYIQSHGSHISLVQHVLTTVVNVIGLFAGRHAGPYYNMQATQATQAT